LTEKPEYIVVGKLGRYRGTSGQIYVHELTDNPERFAKDAAFWIETKSGWKQIEIVSPEVMSGKLVAKIKGVNTKEEVRRYTNLYLHIKDDELGELPDGSYYHFDLVGSRVVSPEGNEYGKVIEVEDFPANDVLLIENSAGEKFRLPAVAAYILEVKTEEKEIIIDPPEGIFDSPDEN